MIKVLLLSLLSTLNVSVYAAEQIITLTVNNMACAMCPFTVKKSLHQVIGVSEVTTSLKARTTTVIYDDDKTSPEDLIKATTNAGYPSTLNLNQDDHNE